MIEDYLNIFDNLITLSDVIDVEIDQKLEELATDFTSGSIPFVDGGHLAEENSDLFWNKVTNVLNATNLIISSLSADELVLTDPNKKLVSGGTLQELKNELNRRSFFYGRAY